MSISEIFAFPFSEGLILAEEGEGGVVNDFGDKFGGFGVNYVTIFVEGREDLV